MKKIETIGVLLLNLGGPSSLGEVKPFLQNLFSDREIIKVGPEFLQKPLTHLISLLRSKKTEKMYSLIGGKSPILDITMAQAEALEKALNKQSTVDSCQSSENNFLLSTRYSLLFKVYIGMRYWHPFIKDTVDEILKDGINRLIVLPLYPHYSKATTGSAISEFKRAISQFTVHGLRRAQSSRSRFTVKYIEQWYDFPPYIDALAELINKGLLEFNSKDVDILYSAHNLPESFINKGDPYLEHIKTTIREVNKKLSFLFRWQLSFQSKSGPVRWLKPSTEETIIELAKAGCRNLFIVPISFVSDNIETLYEIDILYRGLAMRYGMNFKRCQCLNTSERFINALKELVMERIADERR